MSKALDEQVGGDHYKKMKIQPIVYCQKNELNNCESSAIKYVSRHRSKDGRKDIEKAIHCLKLLLEIEYPLDEEETKIPEISRCDGCLRSIQPSRYLPVTFKDGLYFRCLCTDCTKQIREKIAKAL